MSLIPLLLATAYLVISLPDHLQDTLHDASLKAANLTCEQVGAIRTIGALRREEGIYREFCETMNISVRPALISTLRTTAVSPYIFATLSCSFTPQVKGYLI
jgi:hypothetical protein